MAAYASCFVGLMLVFWLVCRISGVNDIFISTADQIFYCTFMAAFLSFAVYPTLDANGFFSRVGAALAMAETGQRD